MKLKNFCFTIQDDLLFQAGDDEELNELVDFAFLKGYISELTQEEERPLHFLKELITNSENLSFPLLIQGKEHLNTLFYEQTALQKKIEKILNYFTTQEKGDGEGVLSQEEFYSLLEFLQESDS